MADDLLRKTEVETAAGGRRRAGPRIGLALGAGAARGWAHIGALHELKAMGLVPDVVVGSSIGALVGGCFAAGRLDELEVLRPLAQPAAGVRPARLFLQRRRADRRRSAARPVAGVDRRDADRRPAGALRRRGDRTRHRPRGVAAPRLADRRDARLLRPARRVRTGPARPSLADRRRGRQSRAGQRRARARRRARHRAQHRHRRHRPRRDPPRRGRDRAARRDRRGSAAGRAPRRRVAAPRPIERQRAGPRLGDGQRLQHHPGPADAFASRRRSARRADQSQGRPDRRVRVRPRRRTRSRSAAKRCGARATRSPSASSSRPPPSG